MIQPALESATRSPLGHRMGIDIGSVTAKVVVLDAHDEMIFSAYRRHRAETSATLCSILQAASESLGDVLVSPMVTGSAGMGISARRRQDRDRDCAQYPARFHAWIPPTRLTAS